jgi:hypothetical protein
VSDSALDIEARLSGRPALLRDSCDRALAYLGGIAGRPVTPSEQAVAGLLELAFPLPERGLGATHVLHVLDEVGSPATVASNGPRYFGFVTGGALPIAQAAAWLTAAWDAVRTQNGWDAAGQGPPAIVCLQAGNVNSGASDPFGPLIEWARGYGADIDRSVVAVRECARGPT